MIVLIGLTTRSYRRGRHHAAIVPSVRSSTAMLNFSGFAGARGADEHVRETSTLSREDRY